MSSYLNPILSDRYLVTQCLHVCLQAAGKWTLQQAAKRQLEGIEWVGFSCYLIGKVTEAACVGITTARVAQSSYIGSGVGLGLSVCYIFGGRALGMGKIPFSANLISKVINAVGVTLAVKNKGFGTWAMCGSGVAFFAVSMLFSLEELEDKQNSPLF